MAIKIVGNPVRHKKRIAEIRERFESSGEQVEVIYENTDHITITNETKSNNNIETTEKNGE